MCFLRRPRPLHLLVGTGGMSASRKAGRLVDDSGVAAARAREATSSANTEAGESNVTVVPSSQLFLSSLSLEYEYPPTFRQLLR